MAAAMSQILKADICVIGAGSAGLTVAAGASQLGAKTILIEAGQMGGDCLNTGCVPSKALLAAAHAAVAHRRAKAFGLEAVPPAVDFPAVMAHVRRVIAEIEPNDSETRFTGLGVTVIRAEAKFTGPGEVLADGRSIRARRFVIAAGARPFLPPVPGLPDIAYLTNETVFALEQLPAHLLVLGGGPIGVELAQAFRRLGSEVSLVEMLGLLPKDDPEAVDVVRRALAEDGVALYERHKVVRASPEGAGLTLEIEGAAARQRLAGTHLLVAAGRRPAVQGLDLAAAGIAHSPQGIQVDAGLRTSNRKVYAIGDIAGGPQFTHLCGYQAGIVLRSALFRLPARQRLEALPWVTFTEPELAHVGLSEAEARSKGPIRILRWPYAENDRAHAERQGRGFIKVVTSVRGRILGADIVGAQAGELIHLWTLAVAKGLGIGAVAGMIAPYPTLGEIGKRAAGNYFLPKLFSERTKRVVRFLARFG
jgi:pyruvate/2-oxoglutarate dehydrogenase complex dihydrolipoamide dehydrogenase (E3) component